MLGLAKILSLSWLIAPAPIETDGARRRRPAKRRCRDLRELSPHLKRDIGLCDVDTRLLR